jgi:hypothetical protein
MSDTNDLARDDREAHEAFVGDLSDALIALLTAHARGIALADVARALPKDVLIADAKASIAQVQGKARAVAEILWTKAEQGSWYRDLERALDHPSPAPGERPG